MDIKVIYFIVIILANTVGAISGMGGGVIIKPVFDTLGAHPLAAISFYSSVAVFTMSIVSTIRQFMNGVKIKYGFAFAISMGSVIGGIAGNNFFDFLLRFFPNEAHVQLIQIILTIIMLVYVLLATKPDMKTYHFENKAWYLGVGFFLGCLSTLLGIGGGPINVTLLMLCFSLPIKEATVYSIITIFFSQLSKIITIGFASGYGSFDLTVLYTIIPAAIIGGFVGGKLSGVLSEKKVMVVYKAVVCLVIFINLFNAVRIFL